MSTTGAADILPEKECSNCGATQDLQRCSRCKGAWFCSLACHKAYWPIHKAECRANDFAAVLDAREPKFAAWMRKHGKQAVIKDAEVERLERASRAVCSLPSRQEVMESMYGHADPRPKGPTYSAEEWVALERRLQQDKAQALRLLTLSPQQRAWQALLPSVERSHGMVCDKYCWTQDLSHVYVYVLLPGHLAPQQVGVTVAADHLEVTFEGVPHIGGRLYKAVDPPGCTWYTDTGVLHIHLLKRCRKGRYMKQLPASASTAPAGARLLAAEGQTPAPATAKPTTAGTAADTFWCAVFSTVSEVEVLPYDHPPTAYFFSTYDADECGGEATTRQ